MTATITIDASGRLVLPRQVREKLHLHAGSKLSLSSSMAAELIEKTILPWVKVIQLSPKELIVAFHDAQSRGIRGGAVYDYLHLAAAKKAGTERFYTLNTSDFTAIHRSGDPEIAVV